MACCGESTNSRQGSVIRQCTDVLWLCIFIAFLCILILIAAFAVVYGNPLLLINGYDSFGNICGAQNEMSGALEMSGMDMTDKPYLFDLDVQNVQGSMKLCVKKCPTSNFLSLKDIENFYETTGSMLCRYDFNFSMLQNEVIETPDGKIEIAVTSSLGPCPVLPVYQSEVVLQRCVPTGGSPSDVLSNMYASLNSPAVLEQLVSDLYSTWSHILLLTVLAFALSLALMLLLKLSTAVTAWIFMLTVTVSALGGSALLWWTYIETKHGLDLTPPEQMLEEAARNERWLLALAIVATLITMVLLSLVIHVGCHVSRLVHLFQEASNCFKALPMLLVQPAITVCVLLTFFCGWTYIVLCLATAVVPDARSLFPFRVEEIEEETEKLADLIEGNSSTLTNFSMASIKSFTLLGFGETSWVRYCWWVYVLALVWISELVLSCQQMAVAGAVVNWYFHKARYSGGGRFLMTSVRRLIWYHLGSVVLGSLLILLCKLPRLILRFTSHRLRSDDACSRCGRTTCCCCLCCYDRGLRVVNHNAYAVIAIEGLDFCPAAQVAYHTMESNALQFATLNSVGDCLLFLGKCSVAAITSCLGLMIMKQDPKLHLYAVPLLLLCIFSFFVAHAVFTLYEMVLDSLFLCVSEDRALSIGEHAFYRPMVVASLTNMTKRNCPSDSTNVIEQQPIRV